MPSGDGISLERLRALLKRLGHEPLDVATALGFGIAHANAEVRRLTENFWQLLLDHSNGAATGTSLPSLSAFLSGAADLISLGPRLRGIGDDLRLELSPFFDLLDRPLGAHFRIRIYTFHSSEQCYRGLLSRGMSPDYVRKFDVQKTADFGRTLAIPFSDPPYELIEQTSCYTLNARDLQKIPAERRDFYEKDLSLGSLAPATYTWHFSDSGLVRDWHGEQTPTLSRYVFALSLDLGKSNQDYDDRVLDPLYLSLFELIFDSSLGEHLASGLNGVYARLKLQTSGASPTLRAAPQRPVPPRSALSADPTLQASFKAVPAGLLRDPYVFSVGDDTCEIPADCALRLSDADERVCLCGRSGTGKGLLASASHWWSDRRHGMFWPRGFNGVQRSTAEPYIYGCEEGAYTPGPETPSDFEVADGGVYVPDDFFLAAEEVQTLLLDVVDLLGKGGWHRRGGKGGMVGRHCDPNVRVIFAGDPGAGHVHAHMMRRLGSIIELPDWPSVARDTRIVILRTYLVRALKKAGLPFGRLSAELFRLLVNGPYPEYVMSTNMDGVRAWIEDRLPIWLSSQDADFSLSKLRKGIPSELPLPASPETYPSSLRIGEGSEFDTQLTKFERLVVTIAKCPNNQTGRLKGAAKLPPCGCVSEAQLAEALPRQQGSNCAAACLEAHYLLLAAVYSRCAAPDSEDPCRTAPGLLLRHFKTPSPYQKWVKEMTASLNPGVEPGFEPGQLKYDGDTNQQHRGGCCFKTHIEDRSTVERLLAATDRISCAWPAFYSAVPYWRRWWDPRVMRKLRARLRGLSSEPRQGSQETSEESYDHEYDD